MSPDGCPVLGSRRKRRQLTLTLDGFVDDGAELGIGLGLQRLRPGDLHESEVEVHIVAGIRIPLGIEEEGDLQEP